jgi:SAM-dependent methyltransferase
MRADYTQVFQDTEAVTKYDDVQYAPDSHSTAVNVRQRRYLRRLVRDAFPQQSPTQHDFACGTGRAVELLHGLVRDAHGYDTSEAMIERAQANGRFASWHVVAATGPVPAPAPTPGPSIVTVFRLLLNVPDDVRDRAIAFAARTLPTYTSGLLVVQNHGSARSLRHLRHRAKAGNPWYSELSDEQVYELLDRHGGTRDVDAADAALDPVEASDRLEDLGPVGQNQLRFDAGLLEKSSPDQFAENKGGQSRTVQDFLGRVRFDRDSALKFQGPAAVVRD